MKPITLLSDKLRWPAQIPLRLLHRAPAARDRLEIQPHTTVTTLLRNDSVLVRPFQLADAVPMYEAARETMDQLCTWMIWCRADYSITDARTFISQCARASERGEHYSFAIVDAQNRTFLGSVGLNHLSPTHKSGSVGYWVRNSAAGRGVATSATRWVAHYAFKQLGLNRLEFLIPAVNVASQRVAQKTGAKFEGVLRKRLMISGKIYDAAVYSLVPTDIPADPTLLSGSS